MTPENVPSVPSPEAAGYAARRRARAAAAARAAFEELERIEHALRSGHVRRAEMIRFRDRLLLAADLVQIAYDGGIERISPWE